MLSSNKERNELMSVNPHRQYCFCVDCDQNEYKFKSKVLTTLIYPVNMISLPTPAFELSDSELKFKFFNY